jgi:hypothetical protein
VSVAAHNSAPLSVVRIVPGRGWLLNLGANRCVSPHREYARYKVLRYAA